jgi:hypothetical protein
MQLGVSDLIDGVVKTLTSTFEDCAVYTDAVPQGLNLPCFFVFVTRFKARARVSLNRQLERQEVMFDVIYNPKDIASLRTESPAIVEKLFEVFRTIDLLTGDKVPVQKREVRYTDEAMIFSMLIPVSVRYPDSDVALMETLELNTIRVR